MYEPVHVLSKTSTRQRRNVFIWCTAQDKVVLGWQVGHDAPVTVATAYRWVTGAVEAQRPKWEPSWKEASSYALFPVVVEPTYVLRYSVRQSGAAALSRESQDIMAPGDYGIYTRDGSDPGLHFFRKTYSFSSKEEKMKRTNHTLMAKTSLTPTIARQALDRDRRCAFSGVVPNRDSGEFALLYDFEPLPTYLEIISSYDQLSDDTWLENKYYEDPDSCDINQYMVITNVISGRKDFVGLFWENKLGIDVDDNYRLVLFEPECLKDVASLKTHATLSDGPLRPSDQFLRFHFHECLAVSVCLGDVREDYKIERIEDFMEELGVFDGEIDLHDSRWSTLLGKEVYAYVMREKMKNFVDDDDEFTADPTI